MRRVGAKLVRLSTVLCGLAAGAAPAAAQIAVVSDLVAERVVGPGKSYEGTILVRNTSDAPQVVRVFQTDYLFSADGTSRYDQPGTVARSNASWLRFSPSQFLIPAGETTPVAYRVQVPAADSLAGTYWSMLMVEPVARETLETGSAPRQGMGVRTVVRYGTQIATHVGDATPHRIEFVDPQVVAEGSERWLEVSVRNPGERAFRAQLWLELYDASGRMLLRDERQQTLLYPGTSARQRFRLRATSAGEHTVLVVADTRGGELFGAQYNVRF